MARSSSSFQRSPAKYRPQATVLVICEDSVSAHGYLERAAQHYRATALIEVLHCGRTDPLGIVEHGIKSSKRFDHVYCVIDRDNHQNFHGALRAARDFNRNLTLIISNPCFEYWLILHFHYSRKGYKLAGNRSSGEQVLRHLISIKEMAEYKKRRKQGFIRSASTQAS